MKRYASSDLTVTTFNSCDAKTRTQFETLVRQLIPGLDNEQGEGDDGTWAWVQENNLEFAPDGPHATFIFKDAATEEIVATCTFTPDDRGQLRKNGLKGLGVWGFVNVLRRDLRR